MMQNKKKKKKLATSNQQPAVTAGVNHQYVFVQLENGLILTSSLLAWLSSDMLEGKDRYICNCK
jgi:hypothetical protein